MREIVLDTETTGLDPADGHRVLEIGCVEIVHQSLTGKVFHVLINPERDVPEEAARVHGHTAETLRDKPAFGERGRRFSRLYRRFESRHPQRRVRHALHERGAGQARARRNRHGAGRRHAGDRAKEASRTAEQPRRTMRPLPDRPLAADRHGALLDAEILVEVYCELMGGRQRSLAFGDAGALAGLHGLLVPARSEPRPPRQSWLEPEEAAAHARYIETSIVEAIWSRYLAPAVLTRPVRETVRPSVAAAGRRSRPVAADRARENRPDR